MLLLLLQEATSSHTQDRRSVWSRQSLSSGPRRRGAFRLGSSQVLRGVSVLALAAFSLFSANAYGAEEAKLQIPEIKIGGDGLELTEWLALGPFRSSEGAIAEDFLSELGTPENEVDSQRFVELWANEPRARHANYSDLRLENIGGQATINFVGLYRILECGQILPQTAAYIACNLRSEFNEAVSLFLGSDDGAKVWLNQNLLFTYTGRRSVRSFDDIVTLNLKQGDNFLLVKVANITGAWAFTGRLELTQSAAIKTSFRVNRSFLQKSIINVDEPLALVGAGQAKEGLCRLVLANAVDGKAPSAATLQDNDSVASSLPGLYRATLILGGAPYSQYVCVGDPSIVTSLLAQKAEAYAKDDRVRINLDAFRRRLELLCQPENRHPNEDSWQSKVVFALSEFRDALASLREGKDPFENTCGLHLRAFRSHIDDQVEHYRIFVPTNYSRFDGMPLIIIMPTVEGQPRPFIESVTIAEHSLAEDLSNLADKFDVGILWMGYRSCASRANPCDIAHWAETLDAVEADYSIDSKRLYLLGMCSSGVDIATAATYWPERFAAIGMVDPVIHRMSNRFGLPDYFVAWPADYNKWLRETDPLPRLAELRRVPVRILQYSDDPAHGPRWHAEAFVRASIQSGGTPIFDDEYDPYGKYNWDANGPWERFIPWFLTKKRETASNDIGPSASRSYAVQDAFQKRFVVVEGTVGTPSELAGVRRITSEFVAAWHRTQLGQCRVTTDAKLSGDDLAESNLVLIGNESVNSYWHRIARRLPLRINPKEVCINGNSWSGADVAFQGIFPDPENPVRSVVLIGAPDLRQAEFGTMDLSIDGWFQYAIWQRTGRQPELTASAIGASDAAHTPNSNRSAVPLISSNR